jgi:hypothetical protein
MCSGVMSDKEFFDEFLKKEFMTLANDKVVNVRIILSKIIKKHFNAKGPYEHDLEINSMVKKMKKDKSQDVKLNMLDLHDFPLNNEESATDCESYLFERSINGIITSTESPDK